jgi:arsenate reductase
MAVCDDEMITGHRLVGFMKHVLFICSGDAAISSMAAVLLNRFGQGKFQGHAAETRAKPIINALALKQIETSGYSAEQLGSRKIAEYLDPTAPVMDFVITVCVEVDQASLPAWPGTPICANWPFELPATTSDSLPVDPQAYAHLFARIELQVRTFLSILTGTVDRSTMQQLLNAIHKVTGR